MGRRLHVCKFQTLNRNLKLNTLRNLKLNTFINSIRKNVARARSLAHIIMLMTFLQVGSTFGRLKIASAILIFSVRREAGSPPSPAALSVWSGRKWM